MKDDTKYRVNLTSRILLGFIFIYHGLVPKILWLSPVEEHLVAASGIGIAATVISPVAGILEIMLGLATIFVRSTLVFIYVAAAVLMGLLFFVGFASPGHLIEAFSPVTTNILGIGLCYIAVITSSRKDA